MSDSFFVFVFHSIFICLTRYYSYLLSFYFYLSQSLVIILIYSHFIFTCLIRVSAGPRGSQHRRGPGTPILRLHPAGSQSRLLPPSSSLRLKDWAHATPTQLPRRGRAATAFLSAHTSSSGVCDGGYNDDKHQRR